MHDDKKPSGLLSGTRTGYSTRKRRAHRIDVRASVPFFGARYYVVILAGRDLRHRARLDAEGQTQWLRQALIVALLLSLVVSTVVGGVVIAYLIKCALGVNIFSGESPLHFVYNVVFQ